MSPGRFTRPQPYEELEHTADAGVRVRGETEEETLARLVLAFADIVSGGGEVSPTEELVIETEPSDRAAMAVDVLRELLFQFDSKGLIPYACEVLRFEPGSGSAVKVELGPWVESAHGEGLVLKAVTLHEARFEPSDTGWLAQVVFDV